MKIRSGFVSNSSSSSFIILLPDAFDVDKVDLSRAEDADEDEVKDAIRNLINGETIWEYDNYPIFNAITEVLGKYIIGGSEGGPEAGQISIADMKKVRAIVNES